MKILVINGPNLNMLGKREPAIYGKQDYKALCTLIKKGAKERGVKVELYQSNHEGKLVDKIQKAINKFDGIIINAGAYTHTSIAILDALKAVNIDTVEVHISNINAREDFRKHSFVSLYAFNSIVGKGFDGYLQAIDCLIEKHKA